MPFKSKCFLYELINTLANFILMCKGKSILNVLNQMNLNLELLLDFWQWLIWLPWFHKSQEKLDILEILLHKYVSLDYNPMFINKFLLLLYHWKWKQWCERANRFKRWKIWFCHKDHFLAEIRWNWYYSWYRSCCWLLPWCGILGAYDMIKK